MSDLRFQPLQAGSRIGIVAPAGPVRKRYIQSGWQMLQAVGFQPVAGFYLFSDEGMVSAPPQNRLEDLYNFLEDPTIRAIWAARGGYGTIQLLASMKMDAFRRNPKCIIGFSDVTTLLWALYAQLHFPSFSGFTLALQFHPQNPYLHLGLQILMGHRTVIDASDLQHPLQVVVPGKAEGLFIGGTLSIICSLLGTPFFPAVKDTPLIVYLEDVDEPLYRIDRYLQQLYLAGFFQSVKAVLLGFFICKEKKMQVVPLLKPLLAPDTVIVNHFPYGHMRDSLLLPVGVWARIQTNPFRLQWESPFQTGIHFPP